MTQEEEIKIAHALESYDGRLLLAEILYTDILIFLKVPDAPIVAKEMISLKRMEDMISANILIDSAFK